MKVKPKKALGQHFLNDEHIAAEIAATVAATNLPAGHPEWGEMPVVEVGPGMGVLSKYLVETGREVTAVELDSESVRYLAREYPRLRVVEGDFLRLDLREVCDRPFALIGNYPYNISTQIFFKVLENMELIPVVAGMLQKGPAHLLGARLEGLRHTVGAAPGLV